MIRKVILALDSVDFSEFRIWERISRLGMVRQGYLPDRYKIQQGCGYDQCEGQKLKIRIIPVRIRLVQPASKSVDFLNVRKISEFSDFFSGQIFTVWLSYYAQNWSRASCEQNLQNDFTLEWIF